MMIIDKIESDQLKEEVPNFKVGDTVKVTTMVVEGKKERPQAFSGIVIARKGRGINESFTVRRISHGEGVERVFPLHSPRVVGIEVERPGAPRRAKLFYLRNSRGQMIVKADKRALIKSSEEKAAKKKAKSEKAKAKKEAKAEKKAAATAKKAAKKTTKKKTAAKKAAEPKETKEPKE
ncbi:MAG: 50S ribosomal protein L19 [Verrucomicrobiota bacterium]